MGLLAPGWLHGCLGLNFAFGRRPLWRRYRIMLFAVALLLPVLSALGFVEMGRELARQRHDEQCRKVSGTRGARDFASGEMPRDHHSPSCHQHLEPQPVGAGLRAG
jgi:hypothetical protein